MEIANYNKAYKEVIEILKYVPEEEIKKIPEDMLKMFEKKQNVNYNFKIDINKTFEEQVLLDETKAILANIFRDYWATPYQKERILAKERQERKELEDEKRKKYNPDDIFKNRINSQKENYTEEYKFTQVPVVVKESFYRKLINFIKRLFQKY